MLLKIALFCNSVGAGGCAGGCGRFLNARTARTHNTMINIHFSVCGQ